MFIFKGERSSSPQTAAEATPFLLLKACIWFHLILKHQPSGPLTRKEDVKDVFLLANSLIAVLGTHTSFPGGPVAKSPPASAGDVGSIPGSGRSPEEGDGNPLQYSCLENPKDREAWWATIQGVTESPAWLRVHAEQLKCPYRVENRDKAFLVITGSSKTQPPLWHPLLSDRSLFLAMSLWNGHSLGQSVLVSCLKTHRATEVSRDLCRHDSVLTWVVSICTGHCDIKSTES